MSGPPLSLMLLCALVAKGKACRVEQSLSAAEISRSVLVACAVRWTDVSTETPLPGMLLDLK